MGVVTHPVMAETLEKWGRVLNLDELVAKAREMVETAEPEMVPVVIAGHSVGVRFLPMSGEEWRLLGLKNPPRPDVLQDLNLGYNVDGVVSSYPDVAIVDGDDVDDMIRVSDSGEKQSKWPIVWRALTATGQKDVAAAMWAAHERTPERLVAEAGKGSAGALKRKRS